MQQVSTFRRMAAAIWGPQSDPSVYGSIELDAQPILDYVEQLRQQSGERVTVNHVVGRAVARLLAEFPDANAYVRLGRLYAREAVDIFFQVAVVDESDKAIAKADLSGTVIREADRKTTVELARELWEQAGRVRRDEDEELARARSSMRWVPSLLLRPLIRFLGFVQYTLNLALPGMPRDPFGSAMVTTVGRFGLTGGFAPLFPPSRCPIVLLVGAVTKRPVVVERDEGDEIAIRPVLPLFVTFDHRVLDGFHASKLAARLQEMLAAPSELDAAPRGE